MKVLNIGVIGVGLMGRNHVRNILELPQYYELVGCYDVSQENISIAEKRFGVRFYDDVISLIRETDALVLTVPSALHLKFGLIAAEHGKHALIEKPIALLSKDANALCDAFSRARKTLMVGHIERFNPVVSVMKDILKNENEIIGICVKRCGPFDNRASDTNVIFDLMIHDLDIVLNYLYPQPVKSLNANAVIAKSQNQSDYAQAIFQHDTGVISSILASRVSEDKTRSVEIHTANALIRGDLLNKTLSISRKTSMTPDLAITSMYTQESIMEKIVLPMVEPLKMELIEFARSIIDDRLPLTNGKDATNALLYAEQIHELTKNAPRIRKS